MINFLSSIFSIWISPDWNVNKKAGNGYISSFTNLNITRLECKCIYKYYRVYRNCDLNITRLECKYPYHLSYIVVQGIWISPDWNVNSCRLCNHYKRAKIWISPDWNVNSIITVTFFDNALIWISPDWNVNKNSREIGSERITNLNITRLECKYFFHIRALLIECNLNITRLECK